MPVIATGRTQEDATQFHVKQNSDSKRESTQIPAPGASPRESMVAVTVSSGSTFSLAESSCYAMSVQGTKQLGME